MSIVIACPKCGTTFLAPEAAAGKCVACRTCRTVIPVPTVPAAVPIAEEPATFETVPPHHAARPSPFPEQPTQREMSPWAWRGLGIATFVVICVIFGFIGAATDPDDPGVAGLRMARKVGAPLALLLIAAVEVGLWIWKSSRSPEKRKD